MENASSRSDNSSKPPVSLFQRLAAAHEASSSTSSSAHNTTAAPSFGGTPHRAANPVTFESFSFSSSPKPNGLVPPSFDNSRPQSSKSDGLGGALMRRMAQVQERMEGVESTSSIPSPVSAPKGPSNGGGTIGEGGAVREGRKSEESRSEFKMEIDPKPNGRQARTPATAATQQTTPLKPPPSTNRLATAPTSGVATTALSTQHPTPISTLSITVPPTLPRSAYDPMRALLQPISPKSALQSSLAILMAESDQVSAEWGEVANQKEQSFDDPLSAANIDALWRAQNALYTPGPALTQSPSPTTSTLPLERLLPRSEEPLGAAASHSPVPDVMSPVKAEEDELVDFRLDTAEPEDTMPIKEEIKTEYNEIDSLNTSTAPVRSPTLPTMLRRTASASTTSTRPSTPNPLLSSTRLVQHIRRRSNASAHEAPGSARTPTRDDDDTWRASLSQVRISPKQSWPFRPGPVSDGAGSKRERSPSPTEHNAPNRDDRPQAKLARTDSVVEPVSRIPPPRPTIQTAPTAGPSSLPAVSQPPPQLSLPLDPNLSRASQSYRPLFLPSPTPEPSPSHLLGSHTSGPSPLASGGSSFPPATGLAPAFVPREVQSSVQQTYRPDHEASRSVESRPSGSFGAASSRGESSSYVGPAQMDDRRLPIPQEAMRLPAPGKRPLERETFEDPRINQEPTPKRRRADEVPQETRRPSSDPPTPPRLDYDRRASTNTSGSAASASWPPAVISLEQAPQAGTPRTNSSTPSDDRDRSAQYGEDSRGQSSAMGQLQNPSPNQGAGRGKNKKKRKASGRGGPPTMDQPRWLPPVDQIVGLPQRPLTPPPPHPPPLPRRESRSPRRDDGRSRSPPRGYPASRGPSFGWSGDHYSPRASSPPPRYSERPYASQYPPNPYVARARSPPRMARSRSPPPRPPPRRASPEPQYRPRSPYREPVSRYGAGPYRSFSARTPPRRSTSPERRRSLTQARDRGWRSPSPRRESPPPRTPPPLPRHLPAPVAVRARPRTPEAASYERRPISRNASKSYPNTPVLPERELERDERDRARELERDYGRGRTYDRPAVGSFSSLPQNPSQTASAPLNAPVSPRAMLRRLPNDSREGELSSRLAPSQYTQSAPQPTAYSIPPSPREDISGTRTVDPRPRPSTTVREPPQPSSEAIRSNTGPSTKRVIVDRSRRAIDDSTLPEERQSLSYRRDDLPPPPRIQTPPFPPRGPHTTARDTESLLQRTSSNVADPRPNLRLLERVSDPSESTDLRSRIGPSSSTKAHTPHPPSRNLQDRLGEPRSPAEAYSTQEHDRGQPRGNPLANLFPPGSHPSTMTTGVGNHPKAGGGSLVDRLGEDTRRGRGRGRGK